MFRFIDGMAHLEALTPTTPEADEVLKSTFPGPVDNFAPFRMTQSGEVVQIPDTEDPTYTLRNIARARGYRSMVYSPLMNKGSSIGCIAVTRVEPSAFTNHHVQLLQTFADQAVIAIENTRLFNETTEALARQTATADVLKVIASSPSNLQPVFDAIAERSNELMHGHSTTVFRLVGNMIELAAFTPVSETADAVLRAAFPRPRSTFSGLDLAFRGEEQETIDAASDASETSRDIARARGFRGRLVVPLKSESGIIGAISITRKEPGAFADKDKELLRTFADQAVIAIQNVELFEEVKAKTRDLEESLQQQTATADVLKVISRSAFDLQTVLDTLVELAVRLCEADIGQIARPDEAGFFRFQAHYGFTVELKEELERIPFRPGRDSVTGRALLERTTVQIVDAQTDPEYKLNKAQSLGGYRSLVGAPLMREGTPIGVLGLSRKSVRPFNDKQMTLLARSPIKRSLLSRTRGCSTRRRRRWSGRPRPPKSSR